MSKPKITSINYSEELPNESAIILYRLIEKMVIDSSPLNPHMIGLFLQDQWMSSIKAERILQMLRSIKRNILKKKFAEYKRTSSGGKDLKLQTKTNAEYLREVPDNGE